MKIIVIGSQQAVLGFSLVGVQGQVATNANEVNRALDEALKAHDIGIVLVTENVARLIQTRMEQLKLHSTVPLIVEIPGPEGMPTDQPTLGEVVRRAIGIKI